MAIRNLYWGNVVAIVPTVGAALATLIYALRLIACRMSTVGWRLEELLMGIGLILSYGVTAFVIYTSSAKESVWTALELNVAIICGCLPLFKPLVHRFLGKVKGQSTRSLRTPHYLNRLSQDPDGFHKISDPHGIRASKNVVVSTDPSGRHSSDVELRGIRVHTAIQQDVESRPNTSSSDAAIETTWPR
ncbi:hypothetical protein APSETT444_000593 [Aspergillus pseudonomiae]